VKDGEKEKEVSGEKEERKETFNAFER
jgi:hypothetical protein